MRRFFANTDLDHAVAEQFFGWKWMAYYGRPTHDNAGYPRECMVREFLSPAATNSEGWVRYLAENQGREADGSEPLAYCYSSANGPARVPAYSADFNAVHEMETELRTLNAWDLYRLQLWVQIQTGGSGLKINEALLAAAECEARCVAALAVVGSKFVTPHEAAK